MNKCCLFVGLLKILYRAQGPTNPRGPIPPPTCGGLHLKPEQSFVWTSPPKFALEGIKPETLRGAHSKVPSEHHQANPSGFCSLLL